MQSSCFILNFTELLQASSSKVYKQWLVSEKAQYANLPLR